MTYPAWFELHRDRQILASPAAMTVYAYLVGQQRGFHEVVDVKTWAVGELLHINRKHVGRVLNLLTTRGYLTEHECGLNRVRRFTINYIRPAPSGRAPNVPTSAA